MEREYYHVKKRVGADVPIAYERGRFVEGLTKFEKKSYPFSNLGVGDFFIVPCETLKQIDRVQCRVSGAAISHARYHNRNVIFVTRRVGGGLACIRVS